ncbi:hypothetical protein QUB60_27880 [Microcoleus sp. A2-C5]|nr:hypothetical protein [Lyngbya sp. CCAP 1446/10]
MSIIIGYLVSSQFPCIIDRVLGANRNHKQNWYYLQSMLELKI